MRNFHVISMNEIGMSSTLEALKNQNNLENTHIWTIRKYADKYLKAYPGSNIHLRMVNNLSEYDMMNFVKEFIISKQEPAMIINDDINQFIIGKTKYSDNKVVKTLDFNLIYDLLERASTICDDTICLYTKNDLITSFNYNKDDMFTRFSTPSGIQFMTGKPYKTKCKKIIKDEGLEFSINSWINKELALKMNLIYAKFQSSVHQGYSKDTIEILGTVYNNSDTFNYNHRFKAYTSNALKVRNWLLNSTIYTSEELKAQSDKIKEYNKLIKEDKIFNEILSNVHNNKYNII